jgi:hypothetical protein
MGLIYSPGQSPFTNQLLAAKTALLGPPTTYARWLDPHACTLGLTGAWAGPWWQACLIIISLNCSTVDYSVVCSPSDRHKCGCVCPSLMSATASLIFEAQSINLLLLVMHVQLWLFPLKMGHLPPIATDSEVFFSRTSMAWAKSLAVATC